MEGSSQFANPLLVNAGLGIPSDLGEESVGSNNLDGGQCNGDVDGNAYLDERLLDESNENVHVFSDGIHASEVYLIVIKDMVDILKIDIENFCLDDVERYEFVGLEVAYMFYSWFARMSGFSVRKGQVVRDRKGEILQQTFVCSCQGYREDRGLTMETRKHEQKIETRCGCNAKFRVHLDILSRHWYVTGFEIDHNHDLLGGALCGLLPAYRKMTQADMFSAACGAVEYLRDLCTKDPRMFVRHCFDNDRSLECLLWCDGESRMNYEIFGDVLTFDATYRKNKYNCPFVVFLGVNHHNQTIVFATGIVIRETEETNAWLLEQFLIAMNGKPPLSVITDGDLAMKDSITKIFPAAHHRLCAWHLLKNASTKIGIPDFMPYLKKCMLADIEVNKFEGLWSEMVQKFALQDNTWINEMYEKKKMWATAHIRGSFFAGIRTTCCCEALHSHIKHYVHSRINMTDFVQQFHKCLTYFRFREIKSDFLSKYGQPMMQTSLRSLEKSAEIQFTKEIFVMFRSIMKRSMLLKITECHEMSTWYIFTVSTYCGDGSVWRVAYCQEPIDLKCSCFRMESIGLPCHHILAVLLYLDFDDLPKCLVMPRWSKFACISHINVGQTQSPMTTEDEIQEHEDSYNSENDYDMSSQE